VLATVFNQLIEQGKQSGRIVQAVFLCLALGFIPSASATVYLSVDEFVAGNFEEVPSVETLWLKGPHQEAAKSLLGHPYRSLRLRFWREAGKTAWVLDEIGKEEPITIGVVVENNEIKEVRILAFRESRGWEVRHPFFTDQFKGLSLKPNQRLSQRIDGISGATLSVRAVTNVSRFALYLHESLNQTALAGAAN
jgi:hypothetical protein